MLEGQGEGAEDVWQGQEPAQVQEWRDLVSFYCPLVHVPKKTNSGSCSVPHPIGGRQEVVRHVAVALYNEAKRPISAPTINVSLGI